MLWNRRKMFSVDREWWLGAAWDWGFDRHVSYEEFVSLSVLRPFHIPVRCVAKICGGWPYSIWSGGA